MGLDGDWLRLVIFLWLLLLLWCWFCDGHLLCRVTVIDLYLFVDGEWEKKACVVESGFFVILL